MKQLEQIIKKEGKSVEILPDYAKLEFRCAPGFSSDGTKEGGTVGARCGKATGYIWESLTGTSQQKNDILVIGCLPIQCKDIGTNTEHTQASWTATQYENDAAPWVVDAVGNPEGPRNVHGGIGEVECNDGYSADGQPKRENSENRKAFAFCFNGNIYVGYPVDIFGKDITPAKMTEDEGYALWKQDKDGQLCIPIKRHWPPLVQKSHGEFIVPPQQQWPWKKPLGFDYDMAAWKIAALTGYQEYSCGVGHVHKQNDDGTYEKMYKVLIDGDGFYEVLGAGKFEDDGIIQEHAMTKLCKPIECRPNPAGGHDGGAGHVLKDKDGKPITTDCTNAWKDKDDRCIVGTQKFECGQDEMNCKYQAGKGVKLSCAAGYTFDGKADGNHEKDIVCDEHGMWKNVSPCLSTACADGKFGDSGAREVTVECKDGQTFTGEADTTCGAKGQECTKTLICDNALPGFKEKEGGRPCKEGKPDDPCACKTITCPNPDFTKAGSQQYMQMTPVDSPQGYGAVVTFTCDPGYSFYGQRFTCAEGVQQCKATYQCDHTGYFMRKESCQTVTPANPLVPEGAENTETALINIPSACERIEDFCVGLRLGGGSQKNAFPPDYNVFECKNYENGGYLDEKCHYACDQVKREVRSMEKTRSRDFSCLEGEEILQCTDSEEWMMTGTPDEDKLQRSLTAEQINTKMEEACLRPEHIRRCEHFSQIANLVHNAGVAAGKQRDQDNGYKTSATQNLQDLCGDSLIFECEKGHKYNKEETILIFECVSTGAGADWMLLDPQGNPQADKILAAGSFECVAQGCPNEPPPWMSANFYKSLFTWSPAEAEHKNPTLTCNIANLGAKNHPCSPNEQRKETIELECQDDDETWEETFMQWLRPSPGQVDRCAYMIKAGDMVLTRTAEGALTMAASKEVLEEEDGWISDDSDPLQRWVWTDFKNKDANLIVSAADAKMVGPDTKLTGIDSMCVAGQDVEACASCWKEKCEKVPCPACDNACKLILKKCPSWEDRSSPELEASSWQILGDYVEGKRSRRGYTPPKCSRRALVLKGMQSAMQGWAGSDSKSTEFFLNLEQVEQLKAVQTVVFKSKGATAIKKEDPNIPVDMEFVIRPCLSHQSC